MPTMRCAQFRSGLLGIVFGLICATAAGAEQVVSSLEELKLLEGTKSQVTVTDGNGQEWRGTVASASETRLSLRIAGEVHQFSVGDVRSVRVRRKDSLVNGVLIGAAVGGALTSLLFLDNECRDDPACYAAVAVYTGIGALAGLSIDALIHRDDVVYTAPAPRVGRAFTVTPFVARERSGVCLTIAF